MAGLLPAPDRSRGLYLLLVALQLTLAVLLPGEPRLTGSVLVAQLIVVALVIWTRGLGLVLAVIATTGSVAVLGLDAIVDHGPKPIVMALVEIATLSLLVVLVPKPRGDTEPLDGPEPPDRS
jgi:hypothetical protein